MTTQSLDSTAVHLLRELAPQVLGVVARRYGDFAAAEDAVQEALIAAAMQWPVAGVPSSPRGWLYQVAVRRMTDHLRSEMARRRREDAIASQAAAAEPFVPPPDAELGMERDDTLVLLFMCCHPALTPPSAIALTLRAVGGLTTAEIANAFLVSEATMAQRISRAKQSIKASQVPFSMPTAAERSERLSAVLHVLYLIFSEGYASSVGPALQRTDLSNEAIRLTRAVRGLLPNDGEVAGLLALMLLTDARRAARTGANGELIPLDEQDRTLWDQRLIAEGTALVSDALSRGSIGSYQLQAAIAAVHDEAGRAESTDWPQIFALYGLLKQTSDNPMVALNHAIAAAMVDGPSAGLELLKPLDTDARMAGHYRLDAVRAHLLEMAGDHGRAIVHYRAAAERTTSIPERNYLTTKAARLAAKEPAVALESARSALPVQDR
ncbi:MAG: sigma-70 family RNA polymerase sigma factor [Gemmatimonadales bacterium]|nr:sigma-70 family RNA polymerase sigma factor [Gemmatimonadales bacterium]